MQLRLKGDGKRLKKRIELLGSNFKELAKANIDLLQVNRRMNEECKAQEERLINIDEKFHDVVNMCSEEKQKNEMLIDQLRLCRKSNEGNAGIDESK